MRKLSIFTMGVGLFLGLFSLHAYAGPAEDNLKTGKSYMTENAKNAKVITLPSGLQYEVLVEGKGDKPRQSDTVTVHYEGKLINGKVFDSSYARGEPISFPVGGVIAGWQEALKLMNTGSTWMLYIPSSLAYGEQGAGGMIGPNETLIFKVNLISIQK
jgi:FKBP-type peptidyl-prolyl cis-trans isomerase FklB